MIAAYLTAERDLGRIAADADVDTLAPTLIGAGHLLFADRNGTPPAAEAVRQGRDHDHRGRGQISHLELLGDHRGTRRCATAERHDGRGQQRESQRRERGQCPAVRR